MLNVKIVHHLNASRIIRLTTINQKSFSHLHFVCNLYNKICSKVFGSHLSYVSVSSFYPSRMFHISKCLLVIHTYLHISTFNFILFVQSKLPKWNSFQAQVHKWKLSSRKFDSVDFLVCVYAYCTSVQCSGIFAKENHLKVITND